MNEDHEDLEGASNRIDTFRRTVRETCGQNNCCKFIIALKDVIKMTVTAGNISSVNETRVNTSQVTRQDGHVAAPLIVGSLAACITAVIVSYAIKPETLPIVSVELLLLLVILSGVGAMVAIGVGYKKKYISITIRNGSGKSEKIMHMYSVLRIFWLVGFGILSLVLNFMYIMATVDCIVTLESRMKMVYSVALLLFIVGQIIFICSVVDVSFRMTAVVQYGFKTIVLANFCVWFWELISHVEESSDHNNRNSTCSTGNSSSAQKLHHVKPYLHPFLTEFILLGAGLILEISGKVTEKKIRISSATESTPLFAENNGSLNDSKNYSTCADHGSVQTTGIITNLHLVDCSGGTFGISLILPILVCLGLLLLPIYIHDQGDGSFIKVYWAYYLIYDVIFVVLVSWGFHKLLRECLPKHEKIEIESSEYILILCGFGVIFESILRFIAAVCVDDELVDDTLSVLLAVESIMNILNVWLQTTFLVIGHNYSRKRTPGAKSCGLQYLCLFLVVMNFGYWCMNSFIEIQFPDVTPIQRTYYKSSVWNSIDYVILPIEIFYRFHSFLSFLKLSIMYSLETDNIHDIHEDEY